MRAQKERRAAQMRSARAALVSLILVTAVLAFTTYRLAQESATEAMIRNVVETGVSEFTSGQMQGARAQD